MIDLSGTATSLIARFGSKTYVTAIDKAGTFNAVTGIPTETETQTALTAVVVKDKIEAQDGTRVTTTDADNKVILIPNCYTPSMSTFFEFGGERYKTTEIDGFNHAGVQQYWRVTCQR